MRATLVLMLFIIAFIFSWFVEFKLRKSLLLVLLQYQKTGNEKKYFELLKSPVMIICLSAKARDLLTLDYYLAYDKYENISKKVVELTSKPISLAKHRDLLIHLMRCYIFFLEKHHEKEAKELETFLVRNCSLDEIFMEIQELHRVYLSPNIELINELERQLETTKEPQQQLIIYQRLAKIAELLKLKNQEHIYNKNA